jgi:PhzF family phenazine biosynthesis protein
MKPVIAHSFTADDCLGNPAAVFIRKGAVPEKEMRRLATELNLPITCFLRLTPEPPYPLRWFTAVTEIALCGHGTLAVAAVLFRKHLRATTPITFTTLAGELAAELEGESIVLDFPAADLTPCTIPHAMLRAFPGLNAVEAREAGEKIVLRVETVGEVLALQPDFPAVRAADWADYRTLIVTAAGGPGADFTCRVFAPLKGLPEDAVTGSAQTLLAPFWSERLGLPVWRGWQASDRGGRFILTPLGNGRLRITGRVWVE